MKILNLIFCFALVISINIAHAATIIGRVVAVADGDTITVLDNTNTQHKIRLASIDAPEKSRLLATYRRSRYPIWFTVNM
jgi:endonuclease YncB( thermonuclease family)